ncbi:MAG TPA: redoxin domain-containing protein [Tepidisphaeraceae bacterium]|nr:redoxin domain-containing protein [Tepidisphaeraceae bacterium]
MKTRALITAVACAAVALSSSGLLAEDAPKTEQPAAQKPAAPEGAAEKAKASDADAPKAEKAATDEQDKTASAAKVSDDARKVLDEVSAAYGKLKSLDLTGTMSVDIDANGKKENHSAEFTASFQSPNKFQHAAKDDITVGSTGTKIYAYQKSAGKYIQYDAPAGKVAPDSLPAPLPQMLGQQDPSILLAMAIDPAQELIFNALDVTKVDDTKLDGQNCPTLKLGLKDSVTQTVAIDPTTHLLRQSVSDATAAVKQQNPAVNSVVFTVNYKTSTPDAQVKPEQFAWAPPAGAKDAKAAADQEASPADALVGKLAPDFNLTGLDGKDVKLSSLKGKVVVLDLWATWCPPCRLSLPHLDKLYQAKKADGLQVFAVDQQEPKEKVKDFVEKTKLTVPVLLDTQGDVGQKYMANAIPETIIVGKDGKVKKVFIGFSAESTPEEMKKIVEKEMK